MSSACKFSTNMMYVPVMMMDNTKTCGQRTQTDCCCKRDSSFGDSFGITSDRQFTAGAANNKETGDCNCRCQKNSEDKMYPKECQGSRFGKSDDNESVSNIAHHHMAYMSLMGQFMRQGQTGQHGQYADRENTVGDIWGDYPMKMIENQNSKVNGFDMNAHGVYWTDTSVPNVIKSGFKIHKIKTSVHQ